jgi:DNA-directed RNA polymerase subunit omega
MIKELKDDTIVDMCGGRFKLTTLMQKRWLELMQGARPTIEVKDGMTELEIIAQEIREGKIALDVEDPSEADSADDE